MKTYYSVEIPRMLCTNIKIIMYILNQKYLTVLCSCQKTIYLYVFFFVRDNLISFFFPPPFIGIRRYGWVNKRNLQQKNLSCIREKYTSDRDRSHKFTMTRSAADFGATIITTAPRGWIEMHARSKRTLLRDLIKTIRLARIRNYNTVYDIMYYIM